MESLGNWIKNFNDPVVKERVWRLGLLTGLRGEKDGTYRPANLERGLLLDRIVQLRKPHAVLEIGTGRGLGAFAMAAAGRAYGVDLSISTVDMIPLNTPQEYAMELEGRQQTIRASCDEVWRKHLDPELRETIKPLTGKTTRTLPALLREGRRFDFIFIDAGHDLFSVAHDLSYSAALLADGGAILMDDFAPLEEFGLGTCVALSHARRLFSEVEVFPSEGLVYGGAVHPGAPRGLVFLSGLRGQVNVSRARLWLWRVAGKVLNMCYRRGSFPARQSGASRRLT